MLHLDQRRYRQAHFYWLPRLLAAVGIIVVLGVGLWLIDRFFVQNTEEPLLAAAQMDTPTSLPSPTAPPSPTPRPVAALVTPTPEPSPTPAPTPYTYVEDGQWIYSDAAVSIKVTRQETEASNGNVIMYVADIRLEDMDYMKALFAKDQAGRNYTEEPNAMAQRSGAALAINGDYYGYRNNGIIVRNGILYRNKPARECMAIYVNGTMKVFTEKEMDVEAELANGLLHTYSFGPGLVLNGELPSKYVSGVNKPNPRTAIGMIEPGHFIFLVADGRNRGYSNGLSMEELGQVMLDLGCVEAYNLDGGATAEMCFFGETINTPSDGGRRTSDILYIAPVE